MESKEKTTIEIKAKIEAPVAAVWKKWTTPEDIVQWNSASEDWHTTKSENDLRPGGKFLSSMEAKDGSMGFDFGGIYDEVQIHKLIESTLGDGRRVRTIFEDKDGITEVTEIFEAENSHPVELQRNGWQAILDNFKKYAENNP